MYSVRNFKFSADVDLEGRVRRIWPFHRPQEVLVSSPFFFFQLHDERVVTFRIVVCTMNSTVSFRMPSSQKRRMRWSLRRWPGLVSALRASSMPNEPESPTFPEKWLSEEHLDALVVLES